MESVPVNGHHSTHQWTFDIISSRALLRCSVARYASSKTCPPWDISYVAVDAALHDISLMTAFLARIVHESVEFSRR
jgi:hypothetical protein